MLQQIADRHDATPARIALAMVPRQEGVIAIPKASAVEPVELNGDALGIQLDDEGIAALDRAFPPRTSEQSLDVIQGQVSRSGRARFKRCAPARDPETGIGVGASA